MACGEVTDLAAPMPSGMVAQFIAAAKYLKFTVQGPVTEIAPAFRYIYDQWLPKSGVELAGGYDLEMYGERFVGPESAESETDILLPVKG